MAKQKVSYICSECGHVYPKWIGRCTECGEWNTITEQVELPRAAVKSGRTLKPKAIGDVSATDDPRLKTGSSELAQSTHCAERTCLQVLVSLICMSLTI